MRSKVCKYLLPNEFVCYQQVCLKRKKTTLVSAPSIRTEDCKFLIMLLLEGGQLGFVRSLLIELDYSQPLYFTNINLD